MEVGGKTLLDRCHELGIAVTAGIWVEHERHGFDYDDPQQVKEQRRKVREAVRKYRDHPALLMWGLGNEMEGPTSYGSDPRIWKELERLAQIVKQEDPQHPVMTVIAGAMPSKIEGIRKYYPSIDVLGVNAYASAAGGGNALISSGWDKPFVLAEFGPMGHWEVQKTPWGAPLEPAGKDKAATYYAAHSTVVEDGKGRCLGSYAFLWGNKQEMTSTWYGMFLPDGAKLPPVDAMAYIWSGKFPNNRCPKIIGIDSPLAGGRFAPGEVVPVTVVASDRKNDNLTFEYEVMAESTDLKVGGDAERKPPSFPEAVREISDGKLEVIMPRKKGAYRLFVTVRDGKDAASRDNYCFLVE